MALIKYTGSVSYQEYSLTKYSALWQPNQISEVIEPRLSKLLATGTFYNFSDFVASDTISIVDITSLGAVENVDCTSIINTALASYDNVYIPPGTFIANNINNWSSNKKLFGAGSQSILKQLSTATTNTNLIDIQFALSQGTSSTSTNLQNITISDLQIRGFNDSPVFEEHTHLIAFTAVSGLTIENCTIKGFKGDGIYAGSALNGQERHSERLAVRNCIFDGVNNENRNGISVIDCDGILIENNKFINITRSNMPGAIDFEPNSLFNIIQHVIVRNNTFINIGGNAGALGMYLKDVVYNANSLPSLIEWSKNRFNNCQIAMLFEFRGLVHDDGTAHIFNLNINRNDVEGCFRPFAIHGGRGLTVANNNFYQCTAGAEMGYLSNFRNLDVEITKNIFDNVGSVGGNGLYIFQVWRGKITYNFFDDCGTGVSGAANAIDFGTNGVSKDIDMLYNDIKSSTGLTLNAIQVEVTHTLSPTTNRFIGNTIHGALGNAFLSENSDSIEQSFTPTLGGTTTDGAVTYTTQVGRYTKIGRRLDFFITVVCSANASTGNVKISIPAKVQASASTFVCGNATITSGAYTGQAIPIMNTALDVNGLPSASGGAITLQNSSLALIASQSAMTINISGSYLAYPTQ